MDTEEAGRHQGRRVRERKPLPEIGKVAAGRVEASWPAPQIVQMVEVDATGLGRAVGESTETDRTSGLNDLLVRAVTGVMARHPNLNGTVEDGELILYDGVDVGIAVDTPGGLIVPVIRDADGRDADGLAGEARRLIEAAREGKLEPIEARAASVTHTHLGAFGIRFGTPALKLGEVVLVVVGAIEDRVVAINGAMAVRLMLPLSVAFDHRITDGVGAARFTQDLKQALESVEGPEAPPSAGTPKAASESPVTLVGPSDPRTVASRSEGTSFRVELATSGQQWVADEPIDEGGTDQGPTPVEAFLGSLVSCLTVSLQNVAKRRKVPVQRVEGRVQANAKKYIEEISVELHVWSEAEAEKVEAMLRPAERGCFVRQSLAESIRYTATLVAHEAEG